MGKEAGNRRLIFSLSSTMLESMKQKKTQKSYSKYRGIQHMSPEELYQTGLKATDPDDVVCLLAASTLAKANREKEQKESHGK